MPKNAVETLEPLLAGAWTDDNVDLMACSETGVSQMRANETAGSGDEYPRHAYVKISLDMQWLATQPPPIQPSQPNSMDENGKRQGDEKLPVACNEVTLLLSYLGKKIPGQDEQYVRFFLFQRIQRPDGDFMPANRDPA